MNVNTGPSRIQRECKPPGAVSASESAPKRRTKFPHSVLVTITAQDLNGERRVCYGCPLQLALERDAAPPAGTQWKVGGQSAMVETAPGGEQTLARYALPPTLQHEIGEFDAGRRAMRPGSYLLVLAWTATHGRLM